MCSWSIGETPITINLLLPVCIALEIFTTPGGQTGWIQRKTSTPKDVLEFVEVILATELLKCDYLYKGGTPPNPGIYL